MSFLLMVHDMDIIKDADDDYAAFSDQHRSALISEYNNNIRRLNNAERFFAKENIKEETAKRWMDECWRIMSIQDDILKKLDNDIYKNQAGFLYEKIPVNCKIDDFDFINGTLKALLDERINNNRFLKSFYIFSFTKKYFKVVGVERVIILLQGEFKRINGDIVLTRKEIIEAFKWMDNNDEGAFIELILNKKVFVNESFYVKNGKTF